jgi:hypothetical protein
MALLGSLPWFLLQGRVGVAFIEPRLSLLIFGYIYMYTFIFKSRFSNSTVMTHVQAFRKLQHFSKKYLQNQLKLPN